MVTAPGVKFWQWSEAFPEKHSLLYTLRTCKKHSRYSIKFAPNSQQVLKNLWERARFGELSDFSSEFSDSAITP